MRVINSIFFPKSSSVLRLDFVPTEVQVEEAIPFAGMVSPLKHFKVTTQIHGQTICVETVLAGDRRVQFILPIAVIFVVSLIIAVRSGDMPGAVIAATVTAFVFLTIFSFLVRIALWRAHDQIVEKMENHLNRSFN